MNQAKKKGYIYTPFSTMDRAEDILSANFVRAAKGKQMRDMIVESDEDKKRMTTHLNALQGKYQKIYDDPDLLGGPTVAERRNAKHYVDAAKHTQSSMVVNSPKNANELLSFKFTEKLDPKTSKLYVSGHGDAGSNVIGSDGSSMTMKQLAGALGNVNAGLDIRLASCKSALSGTSFPFSPSTASQLKSEFKKTMFGGIPDVSGYKGETSRLLPLNLEPKDIHNRVYATFGNPSQRMTGRKIFYRISGLPSPDERIE